MNFYQWVIENITVFFYKKQTKVYIKDENQECEKEESTESKIEAPVVQYFIGAKRKEQVVWWRKKLPQLQHGNSKKWNNNVYMNNYIMNLTNYYKNNNDLYRITTQIRNFTPLNKDDINIIMKFERNELLTILLLQNYCLQYYKEYIDETA